MLSYKFTNDFFGTDVIKIINEIIEILANFNINIIDVEFFRITLTTKKCELEKEPKKLNCYNGSLINSLDCQLCDPKSLVCFVKLNKGELQDYWFKDDRITADKKSFNFSQYSYKVEYPTYVEDDITKLNDFVSKQLERIKIIKNLKNNEIVILQRQKSAKN